MGILFPEKHKFSYIAAAKVRVFGEMSKFFAIFLHFFSKLSLLWASLTQNLAFLKPAAYCSNGFFAVVLEIEFVSVAFHNNRSHLCAS